MKPQRLAPTRSSGRSSATLALALLGVLLLAAGAVLFFGARSGARAVEVAGGPAPEPAPLDLEGVELESGRTAAGQLEPAGAAPWSVHDVGVSAGVRLRGVGRLEGRVVERASPSTEPTRSTGAGVPDVRVDLLAIAPAATDTLGDVLRLAKVGAGMEQRALPLAVARTGPDGAFAFEGVRAGIYFLDARGPYHVPDELVQVRVDRDGSGGPVLCHVRRGARVLGQVVHPDGTPAARAKLALAHGPGHAITAFRTGELRLIEGRADRAGRFVLAGVTPGEGYVLHAMGQGFAVSHLDLPPLVAGEDLEVTLRTVPGARIEGRVVSVAADAGIESDARPLAGARIGAMPRGLRDMQFVEEILAATYAETSPDGGFVLRDVPPGAIDLIAMADGHVPGQSAVLQVAEGGRVLAPDVVLHRGPVLRGTVVDRAGTPLSGVHVRWFTGSFGNFEDFNVSPASLMHQALGDFEFPVTDAQGRFEAGPFSNPRAGQIYLFQGGFNFHRYEWDPERDGNDVVITLERGGSVEGVVVDAETGLPVPLFVISGLGRIDVDLRAPSSLNPVAGGQLVEQPEGRFVVPDIASGRASLTFTAPGYQQHEERRIDVEEGQVTSGLVIELNPGGTLSGVVVDEQGEPVPGAQVAALAGGEWSVGRTFARTQSHRNSGVYSDTAAETFTNGVMSFATRMGTLGDGAVTSGSDGSFELQSVAAGKLSVIARHRDHALGQSEVFTLAAGESREGLEVVLPRGATLYGQVTDRFQRPVEKAVLLAISPAEFSGDNSAEAAVYQGVTDEAGRYEIEHMAGGGYFVVMTRLDGPLDPMALLGRLDLDLVNVPPHTRTRHDLVDETTGACRVFGQVTSAGEPITEGGVVAMSFDPDSLVGIDVKLAQVQPDGTYEFPGLAAGDYEFLWQTGGTELRLDVSVPDRPEYEADLELPWGGVQGRVLDDRTGEPVPDATVYLHRVDVERPGGFLAEMLSNEGSVPRRPTDAEGEFRFLGHQDGEYELTVRPPRSGELRDKYAAAGPVPVTIAGGEVAAGVELRLAPAISVSGSVLGPDGAPVKRASVTLVALGRTASRDSLALLAPVARTRRDGEFELRGVAPGTYELVASAEGFGDGVLFPVEVRDAPLEGLAVHLVRGVPLRIRVRDAEGEPVSGAFASVSTASGRAVTGLDPETDMLSWFSGEGLSREDGLLDGGLLAPGTYDVVVRRGPLRGAREALVVEAGPAVTIDVVVK